VRTPLRSVGALMLLAASVSAQSSNVAAPHWCQIGPPAPDALAPCPAFRASRTFSTSASTTAAFGAPRTTARPGVPLFDKESTGSIGALAVVPSHPNIIYVGSGAGIIRPDLSAGTGMYKASDAGKTWTQSAGLGSVTAGLGSRSARLWSPSPSGPPLLARHRRTRARQDGGGLPGGCRAAGIVDRSVERSGASAA
jgi:hypothetical protein